MSQLVSLPRTSKPMQLMMSATPDMGTTCRWHPHEIPTWLPFGTIRLLLIQMLLLHNNVIYIYSTMTMIIIDINWLHASSLHWKYPSFQLIRSVQWQNPFRIWVCGEWRNVLLQSFLTKQMIEPMYGCDKWHQLIAVSLCILKAWVWHGCNQSVPSIVSWSIHS